MRFDRLETLAEGIMSALPAAGTTIMAYGKILKVKNGKEKSNFQKKYFSFLLWVTQKLIYQQKNEIHR